MTGGSRGHGWEGPAGVGEQWSQVSSEERGTATLETAHWGCVTAQVAAVGWKGGRTPAGFTWSATEQEARHDMGPHMQLQSRPERACP